MNQQFERSNLAQEISEEMAREIQQIDHFIVFSKSPVQYPSENLDHEPVFATSIHSYQDFTRPRLTSPQRNARMSASPTNFPQKPAQVSLVMTKSNQQRSPSILERYAQTIPLSASCQSIPKRCLFPDCVKMSVSKGLCRGHGGGRRCHFAGGCSKSAQSRSIFCWAHGGGQRCDVENCMRSRKTKHFCAAHMNFEIEDSPSSSSGKNSRVPRTRRSRYVPLPSRTPREQRMLPSLDQALSAASLSLPSFPKFPQ